MRRRLLGWGLFLLVAVSASVELIAQLWLGLGDPPLSVADAEIEYLFKPSSSYRRFGNTIRFNEYSMRSDSFPRQKENENETRVMCFGDSVINGGALTDQSRLATTLLQDHLNRVLGGKAIVGNISAGSWGPPNLLAYARKHGLFDADVVVIVVSSHDYADAPTFEPRVGVDPSFPDRKPWCAAWEGFDRYIIGRLSRSRGGNEVQGPPSAANIGTCTQALRDLVQLARKNGAQVILAHHPTREELGTDTLHPGHNAIDQVAIKCGLQLIELTPAMRNAMAAGRDPYRKNDDIHPNDAGQAILADVLAGPIEQACGRNVQSKPRRAGPK